MNKLIETIKKVKPGGMMNVTDDIKTHGGFKGGLNYQNREYPLFSEENIPDYSQTKCLNVDTDILRRNKIVSLFHDDLLSDQLKILRTQVLNRLEERGGNTLLVTSVNPGEGKTLTAINLAVSLSHKLDHTVLLVDANLKTPSIHHFLGLDIQKGLSDYLLGQEDIPDLLVHPGIPKLVLFPGGRPLPNSTELLGASRTELLVKEMKGYYSDRIIIFDSSPILTSADVMVFAPFVDGILIVVEAEKTSGKDIEKAMDLLKDKSLIGIVLNKLR